MANETNNDHFPDCEIGEVLRACGALTVNAATLRLPGGIARRAALERYPGCRAPEAQAAFTADMELRLRFSEMQLIPQIYDFGFDEAQGAWALWARPGKTLREMIGDNPAPVPAVRQVLGQMLRVLAVFQEQTPPFVYVAITPDNIVRLNGGEWVLDGVTVGGPTNPWRHPSAHAEATTAPEVLDVDLGDISPATDLYALGMSVYQFALGKKLFAQQVPAVFQSPAPDKSASDLWLAWQASPQLVLPPLEKLLPGFPQDVSEIVERMLRKKPEERSVAAKDLLDKLNLPLADKVAIDADHDEHGAGGGLGKLLSTTGGGAVMKWLGVAIVALFLLALLALAFNDPSHENIKLEVEQEHYDTTQPSITIRGKSKNVPYNCMLAVAVKNGFVVGRAYTNPDTQNGTFAVDVPLDALGKFLGGVGVINRDGEVYAQHNFTVTRRPPAEVTLLLRTYPTAPNAEVTVTATPAAPVGDDKEPTKPAPTPVRRSAHADANGVLRVTIPYGDFTVVVSHPAFLGFQRTFTPGIDAEQTVVLDLTSVSPVEEMRNVAARDNQAHKALKNDLERLRAAKAAGTITAEEEKELAALEKSAAYFEGASDNARRISREGSLAASDENEGLRRRLAAIDDRYAREREAIMNGPGTAAEKAAKIDALLRRQQQERSDAMLAGNPEKQRLLDNLNARYERERQAILDGPGTPEEKAAKIAALRARHQRERDAILTGDADKTERLTRLRERFDKEREALTSGHAVPERMAEARQLADRYAREREAIMNGPGTPEEKAARLRELEERYKREAAPFRESPRSEDSVRRVAALNDKYAKEREAIMNGPGTPEEKAARLRELEERYQREAAPFRESPHSADIARRVAALDEKYAKEREAIMNGPGTPEEKAARLRELEERYQREAAPFRESPRSADIARRVAALNDKYAKEREAIMNGPGTPEEKAARLRELEKRHEQERAAALRDDAPGSEEADKLATLEDRLAKEREAILNGPGTPEEKMAKLRALEERGAREREALTAAANQAAIRDLDERYRQERLDVIAAPENKKKMTLEEFANKRPAPRSALGLSAADLGTMPLDALLPHVAALLPAKTVDVQLDAILNRLSIDGIVLDEENRDILFRRLAPAMGRLTVDLRIDPNALVASLRSELRREDIEPLTVHPFLIGPQHRLFIGLKANSSDEELTKAAIIASQFMASPELTSVSRLPETAHE